MKIHLFKMFALVLAPILPYALFAQEESSENGTAKREAVRSTFENGVSINNQTVETPHKNSMEMMIQHRFGAINNSDDLWGIYAPANIRLGLTYGILNNLAIGVGTTKGKHLYDFEWKYSPIKQTKGGGMPVTITYYGDVARSAGDNSNFLNQEQVYKSSNKLSYFHEVMVARKFNNHFSLQVGVTYVHYNIVDSIMQQHDFIGVSCVARYKFSPQSSVIFEFDNPMNVSSINKAMRPLPNIGIGYEVSTGNHQFQVFICNANGIVNQETRVYNLNDYGQYMKGWIIGFNITRAWGF